MVAQKAVWMAAAMASQKAVNWVGSMVDSTAG
jgi:hypothetical protein